MCWESVTGQRSNQLNYVPTLFSYPFRKPACLGAFLRFNQFACVACFNMVEPNSEANGHQAKSPSKSVLQANTNPEQLSLPPEMNCAEAIRVGTGSDRATLSQGKQLFIEGHS